MYDYCKAFSHLVLRELSLFQKDTGHSYSSSVLCMYLLHQDRFFQVLPTHELTLALLPDSCMGWSERGIYLTD